MKLSTEEKSSDTSSSQERDHCGNINLNQELFQDSAGLGRNHQGITHEASEVIGLRLDKLIGDAEEEKSPNSRKCGTRNLKASNDQDILEK